MGQAAPKSLSGKQATCAGLGTVAVAVAVKRPWLVCLSARIRMKYPMAVESVSSRRHGPEDGESCHEGLPVLCRVLEVLF